MVLYLLDFRPTILMLRTGLYELACSTCFRCDNKQETISNTEISDPSSCEHFLRANQGSGKHGENLKAYILPKP